MDRLGRNLVGDLGNMAWDLKGMRRHLLGEVKGRNLVVGIMGKMVWNRLGRHMVRKVREVRVVRTHCGEFTPALKGLRLQNITWKFGMQSKMHKRNLRDARSEMPS